MKLLLDTHVVLWWLRDDPRLGRRSRAMIAGGNNEILVSIATPWEVAIKYRIGKLDESSMAVLDAIGSAGMSVIDIRRPHLEALEKLPKGHGDPFDHLILAQAGAEAATLMTGDRQMAAYGIPCIGIS